MNKIKLLFLLICALILGSCSSLIFNYTTGKSLSSATRVVDTLHNREVIILNMSHLDTKENYDSLRRYLDKKKAEGFVVYFEGVARHYTPMDGPYDSLANDTLRRKMRRALGYSLGNYNDKRNKSLPNKYAHSERYVNQSIEILGLTSDKDFWVDLTQRQLIEGFESRFGEIPLTPYDFQTPLNDKYVAPKSDNPDIDYYNFGTDIRNRFIVNSVADSQYDKIIIAYGGGHRMILASMLGKIGYDKMEMFFLKNTK